MKTQTIRIKTGGGILDAALGDGVVFAGYAAKGLGRQTNRLCRLPTPLIRLHTVKWARINHPA